MTLQYPNLTDRLPKHATKSFPTRDLLEVEYIVVHHTVTPADYAVIERIARYHVDTRNWPGIAYHFCITGDGSVYQTNYLTTMSYHAGSVAINRSSIAIAMLGDFTSEHPTPEQIAACNKLIRDIQAEPWTLKVIPHRQAEGASTSCPGATWAEWWNSLLVAPEPTAAYEVVHALQRDELSDLVSARLRDGWRLHGGLVPGSGWSQAVVRGDDSG